MRTAGLCFAIASMVLVGCDVGSVSGSGGGDDTPPPVGNTQLELACEATLTVTGTFAADNAGGEDCDPAGTWTLEVAVDDPGDCTEPHFNAEYVYVASMDPDGGYVVDYQGSDGNPEVDSYKPGSEGGSCRINLEHYSADETEVVYLQAFDDGTGTLGGSGTYELWAEASP